MLAELGGKAGTRCGPAKSGQLHCPLMIRQNSEDVLTANLWSTLELIEPRYWLADTLNAALRSQRFRPQWFRGFAIDFWKKQPRPESTVPWREGRTEVDVILRWENPPTTVFVEMKYGSGLSTGVTHRRLNGCSQNGSELKTPVTRNGTEWSTDQLVRNARVGLRECGWFNDGLFDDDETRRRDFVLIYCSPDGQSELVERYRDPERLLTSIPGHDSVTEHPVTPFVGGLSFHQLIDVLSNHRRHFRRAERIAADRLVEYLHLKLSQQSSK